MHETARETARLIRPWPLGVARHLPRPALSVSLTVAVVTLGYYLASGAWFPEEHSPYWSSPRQITGMSLTYVAILSYLSGFFIYWARRTAESADDLRPLFKHADAETLVARLNRMPPYRFLMATAVGVLLGLANVDLGMMASSFGKLPTWPMDLSLVLGSMAVWIFATQVVSTGLENGLILSRLGRDHVKVDLFRLEQLRPFGRVGVLSTLMVMGTLAITPLQALDAQFRAVNYSFAFAFGVPVAVVLLVLPMWGVHRRIQNEKALSLAEIDARIAVAERDHALDALTHLNALLERKRFLQSLHPWPLDLRGLARVGFYLIIPPLAWVGAALVEMLVQALLEVS